MKIGPYSLPSNVFLAPMAGITDQPFRRLCCQLGAGLAVSEMVSANPKVWHTEKSKKRMVHTSEAGIRSVQIAGSDPQELAFAAQVNVENGAQIIDINMGCPAKKVNKKLAGSALLKEPPLVEAIVKSVVDAVDVPVTLKIRTGWCENTRNGVEIAKIAQANGIQSLAVHGRTRSDFYKGEAEYQTIKAIKQAIDIPVVANGDITDAEKAKYVLDYTGADAVMVGRAAQGRPWIFREINHYLANGTHLPAPQLDEVRAILIEHVKELHRFYGDFMGLRIARKHVSWYMQTHDQEKTFRSRFNGLETTQAQLELLNQYFDNLT
ncbi:tRNA dihydrouridine synthase DusB [Thalassotalea sp. LPB0316]|uniref:tRNA dihydrouridine synthase DusB n=1 Tax=Thalassotalea sp. LPB0316 TaxID=2769490 RepID=UPI001867FCC1|nr:tRNA dihydrouridine synthase DusB [Thalassotalea sp. LPB0316]QOL26160.1 tRNA dihydrouridine synthase DusB [Thalassotalea sp. LPB0316]